MKIWNQAPIVRLLLPFIAGVICCLAGCQQIPVMFPAICFVFLAIIVFYPYYHLSYRFSWIFGIPLFFLLFYLGLRRTEITESRADPVSTNDTIIIRLIQPCIEKDRSYRAIGRVMVKKESGHWNATDEDLLLYFEKSEHAAALQYGDEIILQVRVNPVEGPKNPAAFDFRKYLELKGIRRQTYVRKNDWLPTGRNSGNPLIAFALKLRDRLLQNLSSNGLKGEEYAVGSALLLGYTDKLEPEIMTAYANTGALHVLSVSGLHVAIVYVVFNWLLFFLDRFRHGIVLKALLLITLLWMYALLTGLSPSVMRAATMFSFVIAGKAFSRSTNIYNTLAASVFLLLLLDPRLIADVGFQLSYIAVLGIVYLQEKISSWLDPDNWLMRQIWSVTAVSVAAQIATLPIGLYYFHQFPNYFLISNLVVIPISTLVIYLGIALFVFADLSIAAMWIGLAFHWTVWLLNASVKFMSDLPFATSDSIHVSSIELILMYAIIVLMLSYFEARAIKKLWLCGTCVILILSMQIHEQYQQQRQQSIIVYSHSSGLVVQIIEGQHSKLICDSTALHQEGRLRSVLVPVIGEKGIKTTDTILVNNAVLTYNSSRIARVNTNKKISDPPIKVDVIIAGPGLSLEVNDLIKQFSPKHLLAEAGCTPRQIKVWRKTAEDLNIRFHDLKRDGAYEVSP